MLDPDPPEAVIASGAGTLPLQAHSGCLPPSDRSGHREGFFPGVAPLPAFLAAIARPLLQAIAATPDPDSTLVDLSKISDSLGGKGVLWELFSYHPPSLQLYVRLCAATRTCRAS